MKSRLEICVLLAAVLMASVQATRGVIPGIDGATGARHVEYWGAVDTVVTYFINVNGAPGIAGTADDAAVQSAFDAWTALPGTRLEADYAGTTTQAVANGLDHVNLVTFADNTYPFGLSTLAVGLTTSFEGDTLIDGRTYHRGEIFDADMVFSPTKIFKVGGPGVGADVQSVAAHEAGHLFGLSHTAIRSSTLFYVLPGGTAARTLAPDDQRVYYKAYGTPASLSAASHLTGVVRDGATSDPLGGVLVFAISATGPADTSGCEITVEDGSFEFAGLPDGDYNIGIYPLDGTSNIGYLNAGNVNDYVASIVQNAFQPEYYDAAESNADNPADMTAVSVSAGSTTDVEIITNIDLVPPSVVEVTPGGAAAVAIDGAYVVRFSERIDVGTLADAFSFRPEGGSGIGGNLAVIRDDSVVVFAPLAPLDFATDYTLQISTMLHDRAGNAMAADFSASFMTEDEPPLSISSIAPSKGVPGTLAVINGRGFSTAPVPSVDFNGTPATVVSAGPGRLTVVVPEGVTTGNVTVTNPDLMVSNALVFTALSDREIARGYDSGTVNLSNTPHAVALVPDGSFAYVAVNGGVEAVDINVGGGAYLTRELIAEPGAEFRDVATTPDGRRVYAVSTNASEIMEVNSDPTAGLLFNTVVASRPLNAAPLGVEVDPFGHRAYVSTDAAEVQVWDVRLGSPTYQQQVGVLYSADGISLEGDMAVTPDGARLLALAVSGEVLFYDLGPDTLVSRVAVGTDPRGVVIDPQGSRAYVSHGNGALSVLNLGEVPFFVQSIATGGSLRGVDTTPAGLYAYVADWTGDNLKIVDLDETHATFRSVIATASMISGPVDVAISSDGVYAFSVLQGSLSSSPRMVVTTIGVGPTMRSMVPTAGLPGTQVVITGLQLTSTGDPADTQVDFNGVVATAGADFLSSTEVIVTVPPGVTSGPVTVRVDDGAGHVQASNAFAFTLLQPTSLDGLRKAGEVAVPQGLLCDYVRPVVAFSPDGSYLYYSCGGVDLIHVCDIRPGSPQFNQTIATLDLGPSVDIAITADGKVGFAAPESSVPPFTFYADPNDPRFGTPGPAIDPGIFQPGVLDGITNVHTSPDNATVLMGGADTYAVLTVDASGVSDGVAPVVADSGAVGPATRDVVFHPTGLAAYIATDSPPAMYTLDLNPLSGTFGNFLFALPLNGVAKSLEASPDGSHVYAYTTGLGPDFDVTVYEFNTTVPDSAYQETVCLVSTGDANAYSLYNAFRLAPQGDYAIRTQNTTGFIEYLLGCAGGGEGDVFPQDAQRLDYDFTVDGRRIYAADNLTVSVIMYDFAAAETLTVASGNNQVGVVDEVLAAPIRIRVGTSLPGRRLDGIPIEFEATTGGMLETASGFATSVVVATDIDGFAEARWKLRPTVGADMVQAGATGLPTVVFNATAGIDPETLPLQTAEVLPLDGAVDVSPTTTVLATFSRAVDRLTIDSGTLYVRNASTMTPVAATYGFADGDRKVSLTPSAALAVGTTYELVSTALIQAAAGGGALTNPGTSAFTTVASQVLSIASVSPPSALKGVGVVLAGTGFDPTLANNTVLFNDVATPPFAGNAASLSANVPLTAYPGSIRVAAHGDTSNALPFTVLVPTTSPIDEVIASVSTGSGARTCAVTPDGALCYTVSPDGDLVIPVDVDGVTTYASIPVGDQPLAIVIHPDGSVAYVANFNSGTVSVIGVDPANTSDFNRVVQTITVGTNPVDLAISPDGERLAVANAGSSDVSIIDADASSASHHEVVGRVGSSSGVTTVAVSPDGTIFVGTDTGFLVIDASNAVVGSTQTGTSTRSLAVTPDGTLLFLLTSGGEVLVIDVQDGSPSQYEVVGRAGSGTDVRTLAVSADGTLLYLIPEVGDEVLVLAIEIIAGVSVKDAVGGSPPFSFSAAVIDTIPVGRAPGEVAVDPSGEGLLFVPNEGDATLSIINGSAVPYGVPVPADVEVLPNTLNLQSGGKYVTGRIELPAMFFPQEIDVASIRLQHTVPVVTGKTDFGDVDGDGVLELEAKFDRAAFQAVLPQGEFVPVRIEGIVRGRAFAGEDTISTVRPSVTHPHAAMYVMPGQVTTIDWIGPSGYAADAADVHVSFDDGATWNEVALQIPNSGSVSWTAPEALYERCRVMVTLWQGGSILGQGMSGEPFIISAPVATGLKTFDVSMQDGAAVLRWETSVEFGTRGFVVTRSESETGIYRSVTPDAIEAGGQAAGARYEYRDEGVHANRTYWYKLQEVTDEGPGAEFGPYSVVFRLAYGLDPNVPNPFNPATTIKYAIAADGPVALTIYDVAGRKIRTLVNERQRADVYRVVWDGFNDSGERVASGMYFYKLVAGKYSQTRKMMLLK